MPRWSKRKSFAKRFADREFLYTLLLDSGQTLMAHVPSHHDHHLGEWIGIRAEVDHVVTFAKAVYLGLCEHHVELRPWWFVPRMGFL
jgi:hypothetical protein